ncbi:GDSL-type esterase/lipase family protein [Lactococcus nasutitermitis]|uniref:GDSL-type esterase/lipase family protein n=1 Tax=Lactococcus nasutitermitis TaxID=1652957 RepID=A0ABV9JFX4_9LACT|nr:GDSL-type esterase/lipase family protein [Lactococcus nasutitermitis]
MKITIFGDSITNGYGTENPKILKNKIEEKRSGIDVKLYGVNGDDTYGALYRIKYVKAENADFNFVFFGANDASPYHLIRPKEFQANLLKITNQLGENKTILLTPPYYNELEPTHYSKLSEVELFRQTVLELGRTQKIPVIDIFQAMTNTPNPNVLLKPDGLHFMEVGYELLSDKIIEFVKET